jgi:hypothetical protein
VLKETERVLADCQHGAVKRKKSKQARDKATLAAVAKEMGRPRFAQSARAEEEVGGHQLANRKKKLG